MSGEIEAIVSRCITLKMDSLEYIDAYFGGEFSAEETSQFEKRIQEDPAFADEVAYYLAAYATIKEANIDMRKARFREMYVQGEGRMQVRRMNSGRWFPVLAAAAILGIVALVWVLFLTPADPSRLADRYIRENLTVLPAKMGGEDRMQTGIALYNSGKFGEALKQFEDRLRSDSSDPPALLDAGIVTLRMENYDKALDFFIRLQKLSDPRVNPALFYEAITLMRRNRAGDSDHAKRLLKRIVQDDLNRKGDAQELLGKM
jgi:tetratricopeptide (TPR) repeat protein